MLRSARNDNVSSEIPSMHLLILPGDGIGPEITAATLAVLKAADARFALGLQFEEAPVGYAGLKARNHTIDPDIVEQARRADGVRARADRHISIQRPGARRGQPIDDVAQEPRPVRQYPAGAYLSRISIALRRIRSRDRAREHRGLLRRPQHGGGKRRGAGDQGRRHFAAPHHAAVQRTYRARGIRAGGAGASA